MQLKPVVYGYEVDPKSDTTAAKICRLVGRDKDVLEVGCAVGHQTKFLSGELGCRVTGVEIDGDAAVSAEPYCEQLIVGNIESGALEALPHGKQFDAIVFADVLEHLRDPEAILRSIQPLLRSDGFVVCSVPNVAHASVVYEMGHGRFDYQSSGLLDNTHLRFFTRKSVLGLFAGTGYDVLELQTNELSPDRTEFSTTPVTQDDRTFLNYIQQHNPDSNVYQFILKAAVSRRVADSNVRLYAEEEKVRSLEASLARAQMRIGKLESNLAWINDSVPYRFLRGVKRLASPAHWRQTITKARS